MSISDLKNRVGQEVALSAWVPVTQERVNAFADATGDHQFIHVDAEKAAQGPFGTSTLLTAGTQPSAVVAGRLNADTLTDLAVTNPGSNTVSLLLGAGNGTFASPVPLPVGTEVVVLRGS